MEKIKITEAFIYFIAKYRFQINGSINEVFGKIKKNPGDPNYKRLIDGWALNPSATSTNVVNLVNAGGEIPGVIKSIFTNSNIDYNNKYLEVTCGDAKKINTWKIISNINKKVRNAKTKEWSFPNIKNKILEDYNNINTNGIIRNNIIISPKNKSSAGNSVVQHPIYGTVTLGIDYLYWDLLMNNQCDIFSGNIIEQNVLKWWLANANIKIIEDYERDFSKLIVKFIKEELFIH